MHWLSYTGFDSLFDYPIDEVEDDPDVLEDPIYSMDIQVRDYFYSFFYLKEEWSQYFITARVTEKTICFG